jgi:hypothetical protein
LIKRVLLLFILLFLLGIFTWWFCIHNNEFFPQDLFYNGEPIHPYQVVSTQFGDSSRFEQKSIKYENKVEDDCMKKISHQVTYNKTKNKVHSHVTYVYTFDNDEREHIQYDAYCYIGSYQDKYIILSKTGDTSCTGRFTFLGLIQRLGNTIINAGEIAGGDRMTIKVISLNKNILRYSQCAPLDTIAVQFTDQPIGMFFPYYISGFSLILEVDLDVPMDRHDYHSEIVGLRFDQENYKVDDIPHSGQSDIEYYFDKIADSYVQKGKKQLNCAEAKAFVQEVLRQANFFANSNSDTGITEE